MAAYVVLFRESPIRDQAEMDLYGKMNRENPRDPNLKPLVLYGTQIPLEGTPPDGVVILEFPTMEAAQAWYHSPGYKAAAEHRMKGADYRGVLVQGM